ncbi:MAG: hypothetical protein J7497_04755 [Chitinophagaceae bacterium]|nr:hypothetical protein [Chitinophagaceae bacterium]
MKTYIRFLDMLILSLLVLAVHFQLTDDFIPDSGHRRGMIKMVIISWQTLFFFASFCVFLRYVGTTLSKRFEQ